MSRLRELFEAALSLPVDEREAYLLQASGNDASQVASVMRLLEDDADGARATGSIAPVVGDLVAPVVEAMAWIGTDIGRYRILELVGRGGMSRVYRARRSDGEYEQDVAVKFIRAPRGDPSLVERLAREKDHLASLRHPYICALLDAGITSTGAPYVVTELIAGTTLFEHCDAARLAISARLELFRRILSAVGHAHARLLIHCDIKSGNILVGEGNLPKLLDFGIARLAGDDRPPDAEAQRLLSPATAAPEQFDGGPLNVATDVYSLGLLLHELLCGRPAFDLDGRDAAGLARAAREEPARAMRTLVQDGAARARGLSQGALRRVLGGDLQAVVDRCLQKSPAGRYANVEQLDADVAAVLAQWPIAAHAASPWHQFRRFVQRNVASSALAAVLAAGLVGGIAALAVQRAAIAEQRNAALAQRDRAEAALRIIEDAFLAADPSQTRGIDTRIGDVLEAAVPSIEAAAARQPAMAASLYRTLADVHANLRSDARARDLARAAVEHAETALPAAELSPFWILHARTLIDTGDFAEAEALLERARAAVPAADAEWHVTRSRLLSRRSDSTAAVDEARRAVAMLAARGPEDRLATRARLQLAESLRAVGDFAAALQTLDEMLSWQRNQGSGSPGELRTRLARLQVLSQSGASAAALDDATTLLAEVDQRYGRRSAFGAVALTTHGALQLRHGDRAKGLEALLEALAIDREVHGAGHPRTILRSYNVGLELWRDPRRTAEAEAPLRAALANGAATFGRQVNAVTLFRTALAQYLTSRGRSTEALGLLTEPDVEAAWEQADADNRRRLQDQLARSMEASGCRARATDGRCRRAGTLLAGWPAAAPELP